MKYAILSICLIWVSLPSEFKPVSEINFGGPCNPAVERC